MALAKGSDGTSVRLGLLLGTATLAGSAIAIATHFARQVLTPAPKPDDSVEVLEIEASDTAPSGKRVWLEGPDVDLDGSYSFIFDAHSRETQHTAGHAKVGPVVKRVHSGGRHSRVAREVLSVERGQLRAGARGRITGWWYADPSELGLKTELVALPTENGVSWAWIIHPKRAKRGRWAVHVHGRGALPQETLRGVVPFAEAGITSLVIAYRNDAGAPAGLHGRYGLGLAEQHDVDAAVGWARAQGATKVTLVGWSMGATACVLAAGNGVNAEVIDGLVLDSPALDWPNLLRSQARLARLPGVLADLAMALLRSGFVRGAVPDVKGTDLGALSASRLASLIHVPTLIHASPDDTFVPWQGSLRLAQQRGRLVRLHPARGEHVKLWNTGPEAWNAETALFIEQLGAK